MARRELTDIEGLLLLEPRKFGDARGFFSETYNRRRLAEMGFDAEFVQDNHSLSVEAGVVRGLHFQSPPHAQAKLVRCVRGAILDVVVDLRRASPSFGDHAAVELSAGNWRQLLVPVGFALLILQGISELIKRFAYLGGLIPDPMEKHAGKSSEEELAEEIAHQRDSAAGAKP